MKKLDIEYLILALVILCLNACEVDNFEGPNAQVYGALIDNETNEIIEQEIGTSGEAASIQVIEHGYNTPQIQRWKIMTTGVYRNNLVFSGTYDIIVNNGNFVQLDTIKGYQIKEGENKLDFRLIPNIRIKNAKIEKSGNAIVAKFILQYAHGKGKVREIALFGQADPHPSKSFHLCKVSKDVAEEDINYVNNILNSSKVFTLTLDLDSDAGRKLQAGRNYFFRIGAVPTGLGNGIQEKYNYAPVVSIRL